ncbi:MAG: helix-turn-helix transcriptional regulator [Desulfobacter sp.]
MPDTNRKIGLKIKALRNAYGLSQIQLAEKLNLSFQQIQKYEKGVTAISVVRLQQVADAFGVEMAVFFEPDLPGHDVHEPAPEYAPLISRSDPSQVLTGEEITLLKLFRKIENKKLRQGIILQIKGLVELQHS